MPYLIAASLIWSLSFGITGSLLESLPPVWLALLRLGIALLVFLPFARRVSWRKGLILIAVGMLQFGMMSLAYMWSFKYLKSHEVALFTVMTPLYVALASDLSEKRLEWRNLAIALLAGCGAGMVLWRGVTPSASLKGFVLVELSNLCFATGQIIYRETVQKASAYLHDHQIFCWLYAGGCILLLPVALCTRVSTWPIQTATQWTALLYLGVVVSGVSYFCWNRGARQVKGVVLAVMNNLKIPLGVVASLLIFREKPHSAGVVAGLLLMVAALWSALYVTRKQPKHQSSS